MPALAPTERPESCAVEDVALLLVSLADVALEVSLAVTATAASLVDAEGFTLE